MIGPKGAHPTTRGWVHPRTGELLKARKISESAVAEWHAARAPVVAKKAVPPVKSFDPMGGMTKIELEQYGRELGIELDRRHNKPTLIKQLKSWITKD